jgi:hypothetical protein
MFFSSSPAICQEKGKSVEDKNRSRKNVKCSENRDRLYVRQNVLEQFANILNTSIPEFEKMTGFKFYVDNERAGAFGVYDLTDLTDVDSTATDNCIEFIDKHIYHVVPFLNDYSFSHIIILENGNLKVFRSINCMDRGDKLEDVIEYLNLKLANDEDKNEIIERVKNYRKYGKYIRMDNFSRLNCKPVVNKRWK